MYFRRFVTLLWRNRKLRGKLKWRYYCKAAWIGAGVQLTGFWWKSEQFWFSLLPDDLADAMLEKSECHFKRFIKLLWRNHKEHKEISWKVWLGLAWAISGIRMIQPRRINMATFIKKIMEEEENGK